MQAKIIPVNTNGNTNVTNGTIRILANNTAKVM